MLKPYVRLAVLACAAFAFVSLAPPRARAAETVHLFLRDDKGDVQGESTQQSLGRANSIECVQFEMAASVARETGSGAGSGRLTTQPIRIVKRIDKSSPRLMTMMAAGRDLGNCQFWFFRPNPAGDGSTEKFYTVTLTGARIVSVRQFVPSCLDPASSSSPPQEEVLIMFRAADCTFTNGNITTHFGMAQAAPRRPQAVAARRTAPRAASPAAAPRRPSTARLARTASR